MFVGEPAHGIAELLLFGGEFEVHDEAIAKETRDCRDSPRNAQAASGHVNDLAGSGRDELAPEQAFVFADEDSPAFITGAFQTTLAAGRIANKLTEAFRTGKSVGWHEHDQTLFHGIEHFFRPGYIGNLTQNWIPALDGVEAKLHAGIHVADIGCGFGASTNFMAQAHPASTFIGFDHHAESIAVAMQRARKAGAAKRCQFEVASARNHPGRDDDFVTSFDAPHDMGDPAGASRQVSTTLARDTPPFNRVYEVKA